VPLSELSIQAQSVISQLNAHTTRLTNTLTQLTDDILRSGSRLAYQVELLRGETLSLAETLTEGLHEDIEKFVPGGVQEKFQAVPIPAPAPETHTLAAHQRRLSVATPSLLGTAQVVAPPTVSSSEEKEDGAPEATTEAAAAAPEEPPHITQLRTLTVVRGRLDSVIKTFGDAMEFVFPPSEVSVSSSFLSVSAPDAGGENHSTEEKGQQVLQALRDEISGLLNKSADPIKGIEDAARRIEELKELTKVWKGTAEEKGRTKFIESLAKMVEDKHREVVREIEQQQQSSSLRRDGGAGRAENSDGGLKKNGNGAEGDSQQETKGYGGYGLISQLQRLRTGL